MRPGTATRLTLRGKGLIALVGATLYGLLIVAIVAHQRGTLLNTVIEEQQLSRVEESLGAANTALAYLLLHINAAHRDPHPQGGTGWMARDVQTAERHLRGLQALYPGLEERIARLDRTVNTIHSTDGLPDINELRADAYGLVAEVNRIANAVRMRKNALSTTFRRQYESIAYVPLAMALAGGVVFTGIVLAFFSYLVRDIRKVQERAALVAAGYRGAPLESTRRDELGGLMEALNRVQAELREREQRLELAQQRRFHHEKMAAVGSLAAAIAHEINNPIAAVAGIAQRMRDGKEEGCCPTAPDWCRPEMIIEHSRRVAGISRQLAEHTAPHPLRPELLDLNGLIRNTCNFLGYDPRFRGIALVLDLADLPAVYAVVDHVTQVLMNLLINAADALAGVAGRKPTIRVATRALGSEAVVGVEDNGHGMDAAVMSQIFKESFTTKPPDIGRGLGLFLCKALMQENRGAIELQSAPGVGTTARISLPLDRPAAA